MWQVLFLTNAVLLVRLGKAFSAATQQAYKRPMVAEPVRVTTTAASPAVKPFAAPPAAAAADTQTITDQGNFRPGDKMGADVV